MSRIFTKRGLTYLALAWIGLVAGVAIFGTGGQGARCMKALASSHAPADYCYKFTVTATNASGTSFTNVPVRFSVNASTLISNKQMDPRAWDLLGQEATLSQEVSTMAQSLTSTSSPWWMSFSSIPASSTRVNTLYLGNPEQHRDQGILFAGGDSLSTPHSADFNITDLLVLEVELEAIDADPQDATLASHWSANAGYRLRLVNNAGVLAIQAQVDASQLTVNWQSIWTGEVIRIEMVFNNPDLTLTVDGVLVGSLSTGLGSISTVTTPFIIGNLLDDAYIRDVELIAVTTPRLRYGFDARYMNETVSTNPYQGLVFDYSASAHTATYTFDRPWMTAGAITVVVSSLQLANAPPIITISQSQPDILGPPFSNPTFTPAGQPWLPGGQGAPASFMWSFSIGIIALLLTALVYAKLPIALGLFGLVIAAFVGSLPIIWGLSTDRLDWWWGVTFLAGAFIVVAGVSVFRPR